MTEARIDVRVTTRAPRDVLAGFRDDGVLLARISAPPVGGRANESLCRLIAKAAGVAPSRVSVVRGERSRDKAVRVEGVDDARLRDVLS
jgi:uncharacterized protein (TIGR00251 family)